MERIALGEDIDLIDVMDTLTLMLGVHEEERQDLNKFVILQNQKVLVCCDIRQSAISSTNLE